MTNLEDLIAKFKLSLPQMADMFKMAAILNFRMANVIYQKINSQRVFMLISVLVSTFEQFLLNIQLPAPLFGIRNFEMVQNNE